MASIRSEPAKPPAIWGMSVWMVDDRLAFFAYFNSDQRGVCQRSCPVPDQAASLILRSFVSRSGLRQTSPIGDQLRIWPDHRAGLAARASV